MIGGRRAAGAVSAWRFLKRNPRYIRQWWMAASPESVALIRPTLAVGDTLEATVRALSRTGAVSRVSVVTGRGGERMDGDGSKTG